MQLPCVETRTSVPNRILLSFSTLINDYPHYLPLQQHAHWSNTTLEAIRLTPEAAAENPYIAHPVAVERWLMEGSYSKVWSAREEAPADEYKFFVDSLMGTIR